VRAGSGPIAAAVVRGDGPVDVNRLVVEHGPGLGPLCLACVAYLPGVDGAGVTMMVATAAQQVRYASDTVSGQVEKLQLLLGEGPCRDATSTGRPVVADDLRSRPWRQRWPAFAAAAVEAGAVALFALPLHADGVAIGVMDLYRTTPGSLAGRELTDALVFARAVTHLLLAEALPDAEPNMNDRADIDAAERYLRQRAVVHQATGMISVQLGIPVDEALMRLRAHAFAAGEGVEEVAAEVVARRLRFNNGDGR
jgi:hypothetical protein